ncbi:hypothetical protein [Myxococcus phage Mx1]|nr:hypothetical protein [Myxococcus phage Mx1]
MAYEYLDGIRIRALASVMAPDFDAILRGIHRWYSETFHTPLHVVADLPMDHVLTHWFETKFEALEEEERHNLAIYLLETPEERQLRVESDAADDEAFMRKAQEENEKAAKKKGKAELAFQRMLEKAMSEEDGLKPKQKVVRPHSPKPQLEPEEKITYMSSGDFEAELDKPTGPPPKRRR